METQASSRLLIVDGHAYAYRAFHAIRHLNSPDGSPTNAIYGFIKMLAKMRVVLLPTHLSVVWDGGLAAERMAALPEYKAQRPPMPDALAAQIDALQIYLAASGLASFCENGVEADDLIATQARQAVGRGAGVVIASADKDFMQLVSARVGLFNPNDKSEMIWQAGAVRAKAGVEPEQIVDWLSLIGDTVDNIGGVPGVGPKTATDLLQQFGTVEALYGRLGEVKSERTRAALQAAEPAVRRNQRLIRLRDDLPGAFELEVFSPRPADRARLEALYREWGFKGLLAELPASAPAQGELL
jgi:DNA polymerase-1